MANEDKTERATPHRRQKARERGQVARSRELSGALIGFAGLLAALWVSSGEIERWKACWHLWIDGAWTTDFTVTTPMLNQAGTAVVRWVWAPLVLVWILAMASGIAQGGLVFSAEPLTPQPERMSPARKLGQMFSISGMAPLAKSLIPASVLVYLGVSIVARDWNVLIGAAQLPVGAIAGFAYQRALEICWKSTLVLLVWSAIDYLFERQRLERELRMSKQELRDEYKEIDGNPTVKARLRRLQRQLRRRRMLQDVEQASVVVTNPTHFAVALEYKPQMAAPVVVAKGANALAEQIRRVARWHQIPIAENPALARALFRSVEVGQTIPGKLYAAVAELLAFLYRAQARAQQRMV